MDLEKVLQYAGIVINSKHELFLRLCALNLLNAMAKQKEYKGKVNYGKVKASVYYLAKNLAKDQKLKLCDEMYIKPDEDCLYIRSFGLQFGFHHINANQLAEDYPHLVNKEGKWDGVKLQPIAEQLYDLASEVVEQNLCEGIIKERIQTIINKNNGIQVV